MRIYPTLDSSLHTTAEATYKYFQNDIGLSRIKVEEALKEYKEYVPTFYAQTKDSHIICIDVAYKIYNPSRWHFISDCEKLSLPILFYVALPNGSNYAEYSKEIKDAKRYGIGIVEIEPSINSGEIITSPLSLSLTGLRKFDKKFFPLKYRANISKAEEVFKNGEPNKACSIIYDEIENLSRRISIKTHKLGYWNLHLSDPSELQTCQWANLINKLKSNLNRRSNPNCSQLTDTLLSQVHGVTILRNQSSHKPNSKKTLINRDKQLRTRLESGVDLLLELINASKSLRV